ncbi:hypothetical protein ABT071_35895 [Streptomyces sp. NPDC002506]|uniref:hypothetical protein n=1 Tax=Streptomyces sp. NPDC002506 TaxID=3154536 RepID=UPI00331A8A69
MPPLHEASPAQETPPTVPVVPQPRGEDNDRGHPPAAPIPPSRARDTDRGRPSDRPESPDRDRQIPRTARLLPEDRREFERILDQALLTTSARPELSAVGRRLNTEQLRTIVLAADSWVTGSAAAEYQHYVSAREELRAEAAAPQSALTDDLSPVAGAAAGSVTARTSREGLGGVFAVLAPVLCGAAAAIFLLVGYVLKMLRPEPSFAGTVLTAGWVFASLTTAAILAATIGLLRTALRNGATQVAAEEDIGDERSQEVARAREAWRHALLERGIYPLLRDTLADPAPSDPQRAPRPVTAAGYARPASPARPDEGEPMGRHPDHLSPAAYRSPDVPHPDDDGPPDDGPSRTGPSFTSPDFSTPDFGDPERRPD